MLSVLLDATIESVQTMYRFFVSLGEIRFLLGVALVTFLWFLVRQSSRNRETLRTYKRELNGNDEKYAVKRCLEDGPEKMRHYYYLINKEDKKIPPNCQSAHAEQTWISRTAKTRRLLLFSTRLFSCGGNKYTGRNFSHFQR